MTQIPSEPPLTLYQKVQAAISDMIETHRLHPGAALPSEKELEQAYGVSRITVRRALAELERNGRVVRSKGRSARVAHPIQAHARTRLDDDFMTMLDLVHDTTPQIVRFEWQLPDHEIHAKLELTTREPVLRVDRVRTKQGRPTLHTTAFVPAAIGVKFSREELAELTMIEILARNGIIPLGVEQFMSAVPCSPELAQHLDMTVGSPVFQISRILRDDTGQIIQSLTMSFRGDSFVFHLSALFNDAAPAIQVTSSLHVPAEGDKRAGARRSRPRTSTPCAAQRP